MTEGVLNRYRAYLPLTADTPQLSIGEGSTPLVRSRAIGEQLGLSRLFFKLEGCNPTGSFKDRGMVVAVAKAVEGGSTAIVCASTGNTSASAAAYGAAAGLKTVVLVPEGNIAAGKLSQAIAYGARILVVHGNFDDALRVTRQLADAHSLALVNSVNPHRIEGQKTAAFEVIDDLGEAPDYLVIPVGNAGNITAYWRGFLEYHAKGLSTKLPRMMGFQAEGAAPIVRGSLVANPVTMATAIRIGNPASWSGAVAARDESGGAIDMVNDDEIMQAYQDMARLEGIFCEPASAITIAGLRKIAENSNLDGQSVVCVITGTGLKDPETARDLQNSPPVVVKPDLESVSEALRDM